MAPGSGAVLALVFYLGDDVAVKSVAVGPVTEVMHKPGQSDGQEGRLFFIIFVEV